MRNNKSFTCAICHNTFCFDEVIPAPLVRKPISRLIKNEHPDWSDASHICRADLSRYRSKYIHSLLESERGELSQLDKEILIALQNHELISSNIENEFAQNWTPGEKLADIIANWGGSWSFLIVFALFMIVWVTINSLAVFWQPVDPYPYILLNLLLSCLAAIQVPIIIMSQNRQEANH
jgi:hypothetical protein|nr:DUF1003 domain-containing protein [uncultured Gimesia sp.]